jgi:hypothetical protein
LTPATNLLLAENDYFALGVSEFGGPADLTIAESTSASQLVDHISDRTGAKHWDTYLVLLSTSAQIGEDLIPEAVATIVYDTRFLRRIVRWNVSPDQESLANALRPFLPLPAPQSATASNPLDRLARSLVAYGITDDEATETIERWRAVGRHND